MSDGSPSSLAARIRIDRREIVAVLDASDAPAIRTEPARGHPADQAISVGPSS